LRQRQNPDEGLFPQYFGASYAGLMRLVTWWRQPSVRDAAGLQANDIDLIILATSTPDFGDFQAPLVSCKINWILQMALR
jgi:hypothetical protein